MGFIGFIGFIGIIGFIGFRGLGFRALWESAERCLSMWNPRCPRSDSYFSSRCWWHTEGTLMILLGFWAGQDNTVKNRINRT